MFKNGGSPTSLNASNSAFSRTGVLSEPDQLIPLSRLHLKLVRKENSIFIQFKPLNCQSCMGMYPAPATGGFDGGQRVALNSHWQPQSTCYSLEKS